MKAKKVDLLVLINKIMFLFILGFIEMFIVVYWTKTIVDSRIYMSGLVTLVNVLIWFYVLRTFMDDLNNWYVVISYALGCATGTMVCGLLSKYERSMKKKKSKLNINRIENKALVTE